ncbi:MAG: RNA polymerase subunit sigma-24 [Marinilabiliales bacterium]|jgi:RNA polymerase sigma-70 factor (ECF subfamily)|nr:MAG: RNA polymerase subunit sigma-24 [Marinilabiliales bacterium]
MAVNDKLTSKAQRDFTLVQAAIAGDQKAYASLMNYYHDTLYFMMLKMTNSTLEAEDLTVEAFGKAFKKIDQYSPDYAFSTWLFKIASNNCIDFIRKKRANTVSLNEMHGEDGSLEPVNEVKADVLDPEEEIIRNQKIEILRDFVQKLKPHYRVLVEMRYFDELSYDEIAEESGLPLGTVKAKLFRARDLLYNMAKDSREKF